MPWIFTEERGWADAADHPDLNNRPRFATARKATAVTHRGPAPHGDPSPEQTRSVVTREAG